MDPVASLKVYAQGDAELVIVRDFAAPRALVWDCYTKPELVRRWMAGPRDWTMVVCEIDLRVGGRFRHVSRDGAGHEMTMSGSYLEVAPPERLVHEMSFEPSWYPGKERGTAVFTERGGTTTVTTTVRYESRAARDLVLKSPMESGLAAGFRQIDALLVELSRGRR